MNSRSLSLQEQIAFHLSAGNRDWHWAWVEHQGIVYFARVPRDYQGPVTALTKLIQFVFEEKRDHSFFILRNRLYSTELVGPLSAGMVRLAAKRATGEIQSQDHGLILSFQFREMGQPEQPLIQSRLVPKEEGPGSGNIQTREEAQTALHRLIAQIPRGPILHDYNRPIAAILCGADGEILAWGLNANSQNKTLHAEVRMLQDYYQRFENRLPEKARLYLSLKPCLMCSAMISTLAPSSCRVFYLENDPGPLAQNTDLEKRGMLFPL